MKASLPDDDRTGDVRRLAFELQAPVDMADHHRAGHEHDSRGNPAEDQTKKPKTRTVGRHDTPLKSFLVG